MRLGSWSRRKSQCDRFMRHAKQWRNALIFQGVLQFFVMFAGCPRKIFSSHGSLSNWTAVQSFIRLVVHDCHTVLNRMFLFWKSETTRTHPKVPYNGFLHAQVPHSFGPTTYHYRTLLRCVSVRMFFTVDMTRDGLPSVVGVY